MITLSRAVVSVDMDGVSDHLMGYGYQTGRELTADESVYTRALPRLLEVFARRGVRATFFVIGRDARVQAPRLREMVALGHEVACHSHAHQQPFSDRSLREIRVELFQARSEIEHATGARVLGFRAPGFDVRPHVLEAAAEAGFVYDASVFPGPFLPLVRLMTWWLGSRDPRVWKMVAFRHCLSRASFHHRRLNGGRLLAEFPLTLVPWLKIPLYHTMSHYLGLASFLRLLRWTHRSRPHLSYLLHGIDLLDLEEDGLDPRLASHPGIAVRLSERTRRLETILREIAVRYRTGTFRSILEALGTDTMAPGWEPDGPE